MPTLPPEAIPPLIEAFRGWGFPSLFLMVVTIFFGRPIVQRLFRKLDRDEETANAYALALQNISREMDAKRLLLAELLHSFQNMGKRIDEVSRDASQDRAQQSDLIIEARDAALSASENAKAAASAAQRAADSSDRLFSLYEAERRIPQAPAPIPVRKED